MKRVLAVFVFVGALLFVGGQSAMAVTAPYPAPPVTSQCLPGLRAETGAFVQAATSSCPATSSSTSTEQAAVSDPHDPLAWTGAGFNVALVVGVAIVVVLVGLILMVLGARLSRRAAHRV